MSMNEGIILACAVSLDLLIGDPPRIPHLVTAIGRMIQWLEKTCRRLVPASPTGEKIGGGILVVIVACASFLAAHALLTCAYTFNSALGVLVNIFLCFQTLAAKSLRDAGMRVYRELIGGTLDGARRAAGQIVGRDTAGLDVSGIARATMESVAENASDGVVAPMFYFAIGGAPLAVLYKAINTMDSMLGYKNDKYRHFGYCAARLDDAANFIPARLTAWLMIAGARLLQLNWRRALAVYRRDRAKHASPNAGHPEAACAGALGIRLGGDSSYEGVIISKPVLGGEGRAAAPEDIPTACRLLHGTMTLCFLLCFFPLLILRDDGWRHGWN